MCVCVCVYFIINTYYTNNYMLATQSSKCFIESCHIIFTTNP